MTFWKEYKIKKSQKYFHDKRIYNCDLLAFDTETTTFYKINGKWVTQSDEFSYEKYSAAPKHALVYIWTLAINNEVVYGREISDFFKFWKKYSLINSGRKIVYVHNLGYDFSFFAEYMPLDTVAFARAPHKPIYVKSDMLEIEFRCSYFLTNMSLETAAKEFKLTVQKATGWLNYHKARTPQTTLTNRELQYCEYDVRVIIALIKEVFLPRYNNVANIPITQTGEVRREVRKILSSSQWLAQMYSIKPDLEQYKHLTRIFQGGYTHLNYLYEGEIVENLDCWDFASSYPFEMCTNLFPMSKFRRVINYNPDDKKHAYYFYFSCDNLKALSPWSYISLHKAEVKRTVGVEVDNGKIMTAQHIELWVTDCDYQVIKDNYTFVNPQITNVYAAFKSYLPRDLILYILNAYSGKTKLKGVDNQYSIYCREKQRINAVYGMCCTNSCKPTGIFDITRNTKNGTMWDIEDISDEEITERLAKERPFLNFAWGVWVTAYARQRLWSIISKVGIDGVYSDTDSLKMVNGKKHIGIVEEYNRSVDERILRVCNALDLDPELFYPKDTKGKVHPLGYFDFDGHYEKFKSFGAKKYCYEMDGEFKFVVAGLVKKYVDDNGEHKTINSMDEFVLDTSIKNGRSVMAYFENATPHTLYDYQGNKYVSSNTCGIALTRSNYTFSLSKDYTNFLELYGHAILDITRDKYRSPLRLGL